MASAPLGYNNPKVVDRLREFDLVDQLRIAGQDFYVSDGSRPGESEFPGPADLMHRLIEATDRYGMDTVFLSNSGAEAIESAVKIAYDRAGGGYHAFTFEGGFHGRTLGALSLNRSKEVHRRDFPQIAGIYDLPFCADRDCAADTCDCGFFVGGPGGRDASGDGAAERGTSRLREKLHPVRGHVNPEEDARLSSTWGAGDLLGSLQGALTIDAIREHDLMANAVARGRQFVEMGGDADPENVVDVRGEGLMLAVEFDTPERRNAVQRAAFERGHLVLGCGHRTLRVLPPLDVTEREIELGADLLLDAIGDAA